ncbi:MAG: hypothetical protein ACI30I_06195 [Parabacteroides sp.]
MANKNTKKTASFRQFWTLLRMTEGYNEAYREEIKAGLVHRYSNGATTSLREMRENHPEAYEAMMENLRNVPSVKRAVYDAERDKAGKRVIAAICKWIDTMGYRFRTREEKIDYVKRVACRAARCDRFGSIPLSKMTAIYSLYKKKNDVANRPDPVLSFVMSKN